MTKNKVKSIRDFGQSIWLDFFDREIMNSGKLAKMIKEDGISGVTSNPSIFEKAINNSPDYDEDIRKLSGQKESNNDIFFSLAIKDIQQAAALLKPAYDENKGEDGFVSLEVSPLLAYDTEGTIKQARELWKAVDRKNVMIKIPATKEGLPAIQQCISEGININITLLFGLPRYRQVIDAYITGLEQRIAAGQPVDGVVSVASFFLSRIDTLIDPILEQKGLKEFKTAVAIASAKKAYEIYKEVFTGERFIKLAAKGARRQHLLWASTSSKDPSVSDVKYIETLIGRETINTVPIPTLDAFRDHGKAENRLEEGLNEANNVLSQVAGNGINIDSITQQLEDEGIEKFNMAFDQLLTGIEKKTARALV